MEENEWGCSGDCSSCGETAEPKEEPAAEVGEEVKEEAPVEAPVEAPAEEAPAAETLVEESKAEEPKAESCECCCSVEETKSAEDMVRDLVNQVNVLKEEEKLGVTTRLDPVAADELVAKLGELAVKVGEICKCE